MPERELIRWIGKRLSFDANKVPVGPGDDMALVNVPSRGLLVAVDTIAQGVDFTLASATPEQIGRKALAINLSDVAAMGAVPSWCVASVCLTEGLGATFAKRLSNGLVDASKKYGCPLVGGDITGWRESLVVTVAIGAVPAGRRAITRSGARPGDLVLVTGELGGSILGKHLVFEPRLPEAAWLARHCPPAAMIDISDGLGVDAAHIAEESGVNLRIDAAAVPVSRAAMRMSRRRPAAALKHAVSDGEDFELLFTMPPRLAWRIAKKWPFGTRVHVIGEVRRGRGVTLVYPDGKKARIDSEGYEHL